MKYALVTGASRGLGEGLVDALLEKGFTVFAGVRDLDRYKQSEGYRKRKEESRFSPIQLDIEVKGQIVEAAAEICKETDQLHMLINNAGVNKNTATEGAKERVCTLTRLERAPLQKMFQANAISALELTQAVLSLLEKADQAFIVNISSDKSSFTNAGNSHGNYGYRASKAALNMFTECLTHDLPETVSTFAVEPGSVLTDMNPRGLITPKQSAKRIVAITERWDRTKNGKFLTYDGELHPL
eukprot:gb/GECG01004809.1/.p1 GENE.gb/GECG01004809.1/~~gb/GECG01004809.1/.p1  ORF type:complete len:242 (+),score=30.53 gb/GECG01004809.1/:1-726(+)